MYFSVLTFIDSLVGAVHKSLIIFPADLQRNKAEHGRSGAGGLVQKVAEGSAIPALRQFSEPQRIHGKGWGRKGEPTAVEGRGGRGIRPWGWKSRCGCGVKGCSHIIVWKRKFNWIIS